MNYHVAMNTSEYGAVNTTKGFSVGRKLLQTLNKIIHIYNCWSERKEANIQIPAVERNIACH